MLVKFTFRILEEMAIYDGKREPKSERLLEWTYERKIQITNQHKRNNHTKEHIFSQHKSRQKQGSEG